MPAAVIEDSAGSTRDVTRRLLLSVFETFFRRPLLFLLPLVLLTGLGAWTALGRDPQYRSIGTLSTTGATLLAELTDADNQPFSFETPATLTGRKLSELLRTTAFLDEVIEAAGLADEVEAGVLAPEEIRAMTFAYSDGESLVRVGATSSHPMVSQALATATIESFREWSIAFDARESEVAVAFLEEEVAAAQTDLDEAEADLEAFAIENPGVQSELPLALAARYDQLQGRVEQEEQNVREANSSLQQARLVNRQVETDVDQRLRVLDEPELPTAPDPRMKKMVLEVAIFLVLGAILSIAAVVAAAMLDRTIRTAADVRRKFDLSVLAVVPSARR